jgi:hypothetical protein
MAGSLVFRAFGTTFRTTGGALVEIVHFGFWNREPGPDFVHAAVRIEEKKHSKAIQSGICTSSRMKQPDVQ